MPETSPQGASPESLYEAHKSLPENLVACLLRRKQITLSGAIERADLVQEGCIGLLTAARRFDAKEGVQFKTFATHHIIGAIKAALRVETRAHADYEAAASTCSVDVEREPSKIEQVEARELLRQWLPQLPDRERLAIKRRFFDGCTQAAIAVELNVSERHAGRIIQGALKRLQVLAGSETAHAI